MARTVQIITVHKIHNSKQLLKIKKVAIACKQQKTDLIRFLKVTRLGALAGGAGLMMTDPTVMVVSLAVSSSTYTEKQTISAQTCLRSTAIAIVHTTAGLMKHSTRGLAFDCQILLTAWNTAAVYRKHTGDRPVSENESTLHCLQYS